MNRRILLLAPLALALFALPAQAETKANQLFGAADLPTSNRAMPYGSYAKGCLAGAVSLLGQPSTTLPVGEPLPVLLSGGLLLCCGVLGWRACRARLRRRSDISLPRHLLKNRIEGSPPHKR